MTALRTIAAKRAIVIFLIAFLLIAHLLLVHGHDEPSALEACVVLLGSAMLAVAAGVLLFDPRMFESMAMLGALTVRPFVVDRPPPYPTGTVMRH